MKKGISIIELLVTIVIFTIVSGILVAIFISGWRTFHWQSSQADTQAQAKFVTSTISREIQQADRVLASRTFGAESYTSSATTLILEIPSIDANQYIIEGSYDFEVFYLDPADPKKLKLKREANPSSARRTETKTISGSIENLTFVYKKGDVEVSPAESEIVTIKITTSQTSYGKTQKTSLVGQAKLRNK